MKEDLEEGGGGCRGRKVGKEEEGKMEGTEEEVVRGKGGGSKNREGVSRRDVGQADVVQVS